MSKKNNKKYLDSILIPRTSEGMESFFSKNRVNVYKHIIQIIEQSIDNHQSTAEVFRFDETNYSVIISECDFKENVDFIFNKLIEMEEYELCSYVKTVKAKVDNMVDTLRTNYI